MAPQPKRNFNNNNSSDNTLVGLIFEYGVILGAPASSSTDESIHGMADNIYSAGSTELVADRIRSWLKLHGFYTKNRDREPRVVTALKLLKSYNIGQENKTEWFLLGGVDAKGPKLCVVNTDGTTDGTVSYAALGVGPSRVAAKDVLTRGYRDGMSRDEGVELVGKAIGSSNVDLCVMTRWEKKADYIRNHHFTS